MTTLVTGVQAISGSHTVLELLNSNQDVVVIDNLCSSSEKSLKRVKSMTGKSVRFYCADVLDSALLTRIFTEHDIQTVPTLPV